VSGTSAAGFQTTLFVARPCGTLGAPDLRALGVSAHPMEGAQYSTGFGVPRLFAGRVRGRDLRIDTTPGLAGDRSPLAVTVLPLERGPVRR
jgi:hypothetical protein